MNEKQKLTALVLTLSLMSGHAALASGAPSSQFGFKGWPYRQNNGCVTQNDRWNAAGKPVTKPTVTCPPTAAPTAVPTVAPTAAPIPEPTAEATIVPTIQPTEVPTPVPTMQPTAVPTATPVPTPISTPTTAPKPTQKPVATTVPPSTDDDYTTPSITVQEENAFLLLNQDRIANGRSALALDPALCEIARLKSKDMKENRYFAHTSPTYGSASQMLKTFGYSFTSVGENIAHHATVEKSQAAFMSSDGHRRNILGSQWSKVGIGVWTDDQGFVYVTQLFVR